MSFVNYGISPNQAFPTLGSQRIVTNVVSPVVPLGVQPTVTRTIVPNNTVVVTPPLTVTNTRVVETMIEVDELARANNDANFFADKLIYHIHEYGDSNMLWPIIAQLTVDMQELILDKVMWHFAIRGDVIKALIPAIMYENIPSVKREKPLRIVVTILKEMNRADLIEHIKLKYGDFSF